MLECPACGAAYEDRWRCSCGAPLEFVERPLPATDAPPSNLVEELATRGLWAFDNFLPVTDGVTLGEGATPLVDASRWDAAFKLEYVSPTGSFKDRGGTVTLSRAAALGVDRVLEDSSGNAGAAISTYAARAGIDATIFVPASADPSKLRTIERTGAVVRRVEGSREAVTAACHEAVESGEGWYASHAWNPAFYAGTSTFAIEIAAQCQWTAPDAVVAPIGHGTLFLGAYRGFKALRDAGWIDRLPRLLGAQAAGYAPIAAALDDELETTDAAVGARETNKVADGIRVREPVRREEILAAVDATDGDVIALEAAPVETAHDRLHRAGFHVEPTSAVAPAAVERYRETGELTSDDDVVVPLTGSSL